MHPFTHAPKYSSLRPIGQLHSTFILCEGEDGKLVVIDQHAAHERIGYEKLKEGCRTSRVVSQRLLIPEVVSVPSRNAPYLEDAIPDLDKLGWEIDHFGGETFTVKAVPEIIGDVNLKEAVSAIALDLADHEKPSSHEEKIDMLLRVTACHMQVRAGDKLSNAEVLSLLREMDEYEWSERCPHGRPAVAEVSKEEIGKWFAR
jgi:DNA mismatch repair protein MutL